MQQWEIVAISVAVVAGLAALVWVVYSRQRSRHLQARFGDEYDRTVTELGDRRRAETNLSRREARVKKLDIQPLPISDRRRFREEWSACQSDFVDDPVAAVYGADELVLDIMRARGYPAQDVVEGFEDISASHPWLSQNYREAREIVSRHRRGQATTEELRQAMVHYREIFSQLLEEEGRHEEFKRAS